MRRSSTSTSASEALYARALAVASSVVVVGTAKGAGKTTVFNALRDVAREHAHNIGVTSIGRDGEPVDAVDGTPKPRVRLWPGTAVALPAGLVPASPALEIVELGAWTPLGRMVFARAVLPTACEIGGPPTRSAMRATIERLREIAGGSVLVDGAIDRVAILAGGDDAVIVATGAAAGDTIEAVAATARETVARLTLRALDDGAPAKRTIRIDGALDAPAAERIARDARGATVVVRDPTRITLRGAAFARFADAVDLRCERALRVVAVTTSPRAPGVALEPRGLADAVARVVGLPCFDVVANVTA